jgi:hypothetical protein
MHAYRHAPNDKYTDTDMHPTTKAYKHMPHAWDFQEYLFIFFIQNTNKRFFSPLPPCGGVF